MTAEREYPPFDRPERVATIWVEAWNRRDPDRLANLFDDDAEFVNVTGLWWHDRDSIRRAHAYGLREIFGDSELSLEERRTKWLVDDESAQRAVAVVHAKMRLEGQTPVDDVEAPGRRRTIFSFVVHRTDDTWSCASAQNTEIVPAAETFVVDSDGRLRGVDYGTPEESD